MTNQPATQILAKTYHVKLTLTEDLLGTVPKNKEVYSTYIETKRDKSADVPTDEPEVNTVNETEERGWTGFHSDAEGLFLYDYQVKGFLKEAANVLKDQMGEERKGLTNLRSKVDNYVFVRPRRVRLAKSNGVFERPLRAMTAQGPRVTVVRSDVVPAGTVLEFDLKVLAHKEIKEEVLRTILEYGEFKGLGQFRNGGFGSFSYEITEIN